MRTSSRDIFILAVFYLVMATAVIGVASVGFGISNNARNILIGILLCVGAALVVVWIISFAIRSAIKSQDVQEVLHPPATTEEPGTFRIVGVDKASGNDVELSIFAASPANAKAKVELQGIVVTAVNRV